MFGNLKIGVQPSGKRNGRDSLHQGFSGGTDGAGVGVVETGVVAVVDAGEDQVRGSVQQITDGDLYTVGGRSADAPGGLHRDGKVIRPNQDRVEDRDLLAHAAALFVRRGNPDTTEAGSGPGQTDNPFGMNTVVVDDENVLAHIDSSFFQIAVSIKKRKKKVKEKVKICICCLKALIH